MKKINLKKIFFALLVCFFIFNFNNISFGAILNPPRAPELSGTIPLPSLTLGVGQADSPRDVALTLQILALMTVLSLVPAILLMVTSFTRIIIVLGFVQRYRSPAISAATSHSRACIIFNDVHYVSNMGASL